MRGGTGATADSPLQALDVCLPVELGGVRGMPAAVCVAHSACNARARRAKSPVELVEKRGIARRRPPTAREEQLLAHQ
eukprot:5912692-Alexandrium_andersonii.AAC.1